LTIRTLLLTLAIAFTTSFTQAKDLEALRKTLIHPIVQIHVGKDMGSGTVIGKLGDEKALILTNWHIVKNGTFAKVRFGVGGLFFLKPPITAVKFVFDKRGLDVASIEKGAKFLYGDSELDLALLEVRMDFPVAELATVEEANRIEVLKKVVMVGCPLFRQPILTEGRIADLFVMFPPKKNTYWLTTAPCINGNSGGAVFAKIDGKWKVIGIPNMVLGLGEHPIPHLNAIIPIVNVHKFLKEWESAKSANSDSWKIGIGKDNDS
jgi:S1-C subfamily serine protease